MLPVPLVGLAGSFLGEIDDSAREELLSSANLLDLRRGQRVYPDLSERRIGFVLEGIARAYVSGPDGRQLTTRYVRERSIIVTSAPGTTSGPLPVAHDAVTPVTIVDLDFAAVVALQRSNPTAGRALAAETTRRLADVLRTFTATYFGTLKDRLAAHLLDTAEGQQEEGDMVAPVTQQELAIALGTAREVVGRALRQFQADGLVLVQRGGVRILDAKRLIAAAGPWWKPSRSLIMDGELADDLYDASPHPVIAIDSDGQAVYANPATKHVFGLEPREVVGRSATMLIGLPNRAPWSAVLPRFTQDREAGPVGLEGDCTGTRSDGSEFPAEITILPAYRGDAVVVFATVVDLSYRDALRARLARQQGPVAP